MLKKIFFITTGALIIAAAVITFFYKPEGNLFILPVGLLLFITGINTRIKKEPTDKQKMKRQIKILKKFMRGKYRH